MRPILSVLILLAVGAACGGSSGPYAVSAPGPPVSGVPATDDPIDPPPPDEPTPGDPSPVDPNPVDPDPMAPDPTPVDPDPTDPVPSGPHTDISSGALQTTADRFVLERGESGWETTIPFTYHNPIAGPVFVVTCLEPSPPNLEKWVDGRWVLAWSAVRLMCLGPVLRIEAGATYSGSLWLFAGFPSGNTYPKFQLDDPEGVYRLVWEPLSSYQPQYPFGPLLPLDDRVSNPIELIEGD